MPRMLLAIALLLLWGGMAVQAEHDVVIPPKCAAAHEAVKKATGQVDGPVIPETMSRAEQKAVLQAWKAKRQPAIDAAQLEFDTCMSQHHR